MSYLALKRLLDFSLALLALVVLFPALLVVAAAIKLDSGGPVIFKQKRIGKAGAQFTILKFRTMSVNAPSTVPTHMLQDPGAYITKVGALLRRTSIDELPQLWNVLMGDMSLVGPRPALPNQQDLIAEREKYGANDVPPGLTGWAQINGRDELDIELKARLDGEYVRRMSILFDVHCAFYTILKVVRQEDVIEGGTVVSGKRNTMG